MTSTDNNNDLFLGFDLSTQQLKIIASYGNLLPYKTYRVDFDSELGEKYGIKKGVINIEKTGEIYAPVEMWIEALDLCFSKMKSDNFPFKQVKSMSGSCQQHGSVYWSDKAPELFSNLTSSKPLKDQLCPTAFTFQTSPNWQDHSTGLEIEAFEKQVGGESQLAKITGSKAHYRFTGPQIRKLATRKDPAKYHETYRISLISSFLSSLLCNKITKIEESDGCGMNLYDIQKSQFDEDLLALAAGVSSEIDGASKEDRAKGIAELKEKLGEVEPVGHQSVGNIGSYFVEKYGFDANCEVNSFTGDNLATIIALPLAKSDILVSMGTSTTVLLVTDQYKPSPNYHIFKHPTIPGHYMGMLCYCNGALAREQIRDKINLKYKVGKDEDPWAKFNSILDASKPLNDKLELGIHFPLGEIIPNAKPCERRFTFDSKANKLVELTPAQAWSLEDDVASIIESQALSCRLRAGPMLQVDDNDDGSSSNVTSEHDKEVLQKLAKFGKTQSDGILQNDKAVVAKPNKVFFVGGSSKNTSIVHKYCSIFGAQQGNYKIDLSDACALGGCFKAAWSFQQKDNSQEEDYGVWLNRKYDWNHGVETLTKYKDLWDEYVDGVGLLSLAEQQLEK
ncbi:unnamed protein product [Ambrosiozyma monospora]|uniref:Xylulose kinase n=1 Tax=Ambrosiozyma monospora TaxID=43982 RepID=A0A9W6WEG6_AMBMO|nr:unnamed protein product [Ambrosiozyma monospora]